MSFKSRKVRHKKPSQEEMGMDADSTSIKPERQRVSVKDLAVLATIAGVSASGLVTLIFGYDNILEKCATMEVTYVIGAFCLFAVTICLLTYILLRMTVHYLIYVGLGVLLATIFPGHPSRVMTWVQKIFDRAKKRRGRNQK